MIYSIDNQSERVIVHAGQVICKVDEDNYHGEVALAAIKGLMQTMTSDSLGTHLSVPYETTTDKGKQWIMLAHSIVRLRVGDHLSGEQLEFIGGLDKTKGKWETYQTTSPHGQYQGQELTAPSVSLRVDQAFIPR